MFSTNPAQKIIKSRIKNDGFALIIAFSLMAFVLLLILSLSTLIQVENSSSATHQQRILAETNALLGVQLALGNLQVAAGPDQRVTATGTIIDTVDPTKSNYTAVWDTSISGGNVGAPLAWLVSGGDQAEFDPTTATNTNWPVLVSSRNGETVDAVRAAPITIQNNNTVFGQVAWWVGDEGVKATFNLAESSYFRDPSTDENDRLATAGRFGMEAIDGIETLYPYEDDNFAKDLQKTLTRGQGKIRDTALEVPLNDSFHDIGFYSRQVLANVRDGGLKEDLTHFFEGGTDGPSGALISGSNAPFDRITWEQLRSFYNLAEDIETEEIAARAQTATEHGLFPILTMMHLNFGFTVASNYNGTAPIDPASRLYTIHSHIRPWFVLSNPHNLTITANNFRIEFIPSTGARLKVSYQGSSSLVSSLDTPFTRILEDMVFVVPQLTIAPGESLYFSLADTAEPAYDYDFEFNSGGFYSPYSGYLSNTRQQFVFQPNDDGGLTSIRLEGSATVAGDLLEDGATPNPRIRELFWELSGGGAYAFRTSISNENELGSAQEQLQIIGPFGNGGINRNASNMSYFGFWDINALPTSLNDFTRTLYTRNGSIDMGTPASKELRTTAGSMIFVLHQAITDTVDSIYTGYDGWATDYNLRSPVASRHKSAQTYPIAYQHQASENGADWFNWMTLSSLGAAPQYPWAAGYPQHLRTPSQPAVEVRRGIFFDIPKISTVTEQPAIASLGRLQHFNSSGWVDDMAGENISSFDDQASLNYAPSYSIGNSYASPYIPRQATTATDASYDFIDTSYQLNEVLWDRYFFSSIPQDTEDTIDFDRLPNNRLIPIATDTPDNTYRATVTSAAENLYVDGAFNVNSTSVDAWYALLNSFRGFDFNGQTDLQGIFPRSLQQAPLMADGTVSGGVESQAAADANWAGWRHIEDDLSTPEDRKLYQLAEAIVEEVRDRGPFVSMADFINRRLVERTASNSRHGLSGTLQAALDRTLNKNFDSVFDVDLSKIAGGTLINEGIVDGDHVGSGPIRELDGASIRPSSSASAAPGWILQGDLLQALAPALTVRSDTFMIRSYGSVEDPFTGKTVSEAYIEAIVQRTPFYIDDSQTPSTALSDLNPTNQLAGRKFDIISIRYLDPSDL